MAASYLDGRQGTTEWVYANPPQLQVPTGFTAYRMPLDHELHPPEVQLRWDPVAGATGYRLFGSGQPPGGTLVAARLVQLGATIYHKSIMEMEFEFANLAYGVHSWQLTADYGGAWQGGMPTASVTLVNYCAPPQPTPGPAPDTLVFVESTSQSNRIVSVQWRKVSGAVAYTVERENYTGFGSVILGSTCLTPVAFTGFLSFDWASSFVTSIVFEDASGGLAVGSTYRYRVTAFGATGQKGSRTGVWLVKAP